MEKRGVVAPGITPPLDKTQKNEKDPSKLEKSLTKKASEQVKQDTKNKRKE